MKVYYTTLNSIYHTRFNNTNSLCLKRASGTHPSVGRSMKILFFFIILLQSIATRAQQTPPNYIFVTDNGEKYDYSVSKNIIPGCRTKTGAITAANSSPCRTPADAQAHGVNLDNSLLENYNFRSSLNSDHLIYRKRIKVTVPSSWFSLVKKSYIHRLTANFINNSSGGVCLKVWAISSGNSIERERANLVYGLLITYPNTCSGHFFKSLSIL